MLRDVFWTILVVWLLYRIWGAVKGARGTTTVFQRHEHYYPPRQEKEGEVKIVRNPGSAGDKAAENSEYTDYEEIK